MIRIVPSRPSRLAEFREYWDAAVAYQTRYGVARSPVFPDSIIAGEIGVERHFMALRDDEVCAGFFSVTASDRGIWGERDRDDAIYIHRMCVNPLAKGGSLASDALKWAYGYAAGRGRRFVRMDTWGDNDRLIDYYKACGYRPAGFKDIGNDPGLSAHYHGIRLALFENPVA